MLLSHVVDKTEKRPRGTKAFRRGSGGVESRRPAAPAGVPCCSNCGLPLLDAHKVLLRERRLVERLLEENEAFKQSLSDEIYEGFNQQLIGAFMHLQGFEQMQQENPAEAREIFRTGLELLRDTLDEARRIADRLKPPVLDDFGVTEGVEQLVCQMRRYGGPEIEFLQSGALENISSRMKTVVFRSIQELLGNACNHSGSPKVRLELTSGERFLRIKIQDWGVGFDPTRVTEDFLGLRKIRERARLLGGRAIVHSAPGKGTRIVVEFPIAKADQ